MIANSSFQKLSGLRNAVKVTGGMSLSFQYVDREEKREEEKERREGKPENHLRGNQYSA